MIQTRKRTQVVRIGLQLLYLTIPPILILLLILRRYEVENDYLVNLVFGGFICILIEAVLLMKFFRQRIADDNYDLAKIIREQVDELFGMTPLDEVDQKNRRKYYTPEQTVYNRLFQARASNIYQNVMAYLRSNQQVDYLPRMRNLQSRCAMIEQRLKIMSKIYEFIISNYEETSKIYAKVAARNNKEQFSKMEFYKVNSDVADARVFAMYGELESNVGLAAGEGGNSPKCLSWVQINEVVQQMGNIYKTNRRDITELCSRPLDLVGLDIRGNNAAIIQKMKSHYSIFKDCQEKVSDLTDKIIQQKGKIDLMEIQYMRVRKIHDNYEAELNAELNLQLGRVQLSNLNVRECNARDLKIKAAEQLFLECEKAQTQMQNHEQTVERNSRTLFRSLIETQSKSLSFVLKCIRDDLKANTKNQKLHIGQSLSEYKTCLPNVDQPMFSQSNTVQYYSGKFESTLSQKNTQKVFLRNFFEQIVNQDTRRCEKVLGACSQFASEMDKHGGSINIERHAIGMLKMLYENRLLYIAMVRKSLDRVNLRILQFEETLAVTRKQVKVSAQKYRNMIVRFKDQRRITSPQLMREFKQSEDELAHYVNQFKNFNMGDGIYQTQLMTAVSDLMLNNLRLVESEAVKLESLNEDYDQEPEREAKFRNYKMAYEKDMSDGELSKDDIYVINKLLDTFFEEWREGEAFHKTIEKELYLAFNRKRPEILDEFTIQYFKIDNKNCPIISAARTYPSTEIFHFILELDINFHGEVYVSVKSRIKIRNGINIDIKILVKRFVATLQICYTPLLLGKSYISMMSEPTIDLELQVQIGSLSLHKIPLLSKIIKALMIVKLRKLVVWPSRSSIFIPVSLKDTRIQGVRDRLKFQRQEEERQKMA